MSMDVVYVAIMVWFFVLCRITLAFLAEERK
jgi:hypothetical protein